MGTLFSPGHSVLYLNNHLVNPEPSRESFCLHTFRSRTLAIPDQDQSIGVFGHLLVAHWAGHSSIEVPGRIEADKGYMLSGAGVGVYLAGLIYARRASGNDLRDLPAARIGGIEDHGDVSYMPAPGDDGLHADAPHFRHARALALALDRAELMERSTGRRFASLRHATSQ